MIVKLSSLSSVGLVRPTRVMLVFSVIDAFESRLVPVGIRLLNLTFYMP